MQENVAILHSYNCPLVSIIIPAYNTAPYIHKAIESSLRQTHKNVEVLVVNDGSTDDTLKIAQEYAARDERVRVFTQENAGVSAARNHAMREAKGEYMTFLDSDDWLEDDGVEILLDAQLKHPDKLIFAHYYHVLENGTISLANPNVSQDAFLDIHDIALDYCGVRAECAGSHSACAKIYSSKVIADSIDFPEGITHSEDAVFVIKYLYRVNGVYFINKPVYDVFFRPGSAIRSSYRPFMFQSQIDAYDILINLPENTPEIKTLMSISRTSFVVKYIILSFKREKDGMGEKEIAEIRNFVRPYADEFLSCKSLTLLIKIKFLIGMYLPSWLGYCIFSCWKIVKVIIGRK